MDMDARGSKKLRASLPDYRPNQQRIIMAARGGGQERPPISFKRIAGRVGIGRPDIFRRCCQYEVRVQVSSPGPALIGKI